MLCNNAGRTKIRRTMSYQRCRQSPLLNLLLMACAAVDAGWFGFGPGEFHRWQTLDMHLPVHKVHLDALKELKRDYHMHFSIPNTHNVSMGTLQMMHEILNEVRQDREREKAKRQKAWAQRSPDNGMACSSHEDCLQMQFCRLQILCSNKGRETHFRDQVHGAQS